MLKKKSEKVEKNEEGQRVPDEAIAALAQKVYKMFGEQLVDVINKNVAAQLGAFASKIKELEGVVNSLEKDVRYLKSMSDEKTRELLRATLEVGMESIAEKSAKRAVSIVGVGNIEKLFEALSELGEHEKRLTQAIKEFASEKEKINELLNRMDSAVKTLEGLPAKVNSEVGEKMNDALNEFASKLDELVEEAGREIKNNLIVDKNLIEKAVERTLKTIVETKFEDVVAEMQGIHSRLDALGKSVQELRNIEEEIAKIFGEIDSLKNLIKERSYEDMYDLKQTMSKATENEDEEPTLY